MLGQIPIDILVNTKKLNLKIDDDSLNQEIGPLLNRTLLTGGKRLRPMLTLLMGEFFGIKAKEVSPFARAIEMVHAATLAHDDVIDNATERRGNPSINIVSTNKKAILSGDYLLAQIMMELASTGNNRLVYEMSQVLKDLVDGEWLQTKNIFDRDIKWEDIENVARKKTSSVIQWCCIVPPILSNQDDHIIEKARQFGIELGLAFQMVDDVLDFEKDVGKDNIQDIKNGILNTVSYILIRNNPQSLVKIKNGESPEDIYSDDEIRTAAKTIREKAIHKLDTARGILKTLSKEMRNDNFSVRAQKGLEALLVELGNRKN